MQKMNPSVSLNRRTLSKASLATLVALKAGTLVHAQDATPVDGEASPEAGMAPEVLATGLLDPRFMAIDGDNIYFTESGTGGDEEVSTTDGEVISMSGHTGKLSVFNAADGSVTEIVSDFRSYTFGDHGEIVGAAGLALDGAGSAFVAVGSPGPFVGNMTLTGEEGVVYKVDLASGEKEVVADLVTWEIEQNPDPVAIDSNLYGAAFLDGVVYVADAGGNSIISVDAETGEVATFAVTGGLETPLFGEAGNPAREGEAEIDSVPSCVVAGPDGRLYVSYVTGGPFPAGGAPVDAFSVDGMEERVAEGLTMVGDLAFDSSGRMYASIISTNFIEQGPGQVVRIEEDGSLTPVVDGVPVPAGIEFDGADNLYVMTFSAVAPDGGQLWRFNGVGAAGGESTPAATPVADAGSGTVSVTLVNGEIQPAELTIAANTDVTISVKNEGTFGHDFTLEDQGMGTSLLDPGSSEDVVVNLAAGTYVYYCSVPGHREAGMMGTLTVE